VLTSEQRGEAKAFMLAKREQRSREAREQKQAKAERDALDRELAHERWHHENMPEWLKNIPDNYTAQLAIMGWFLTITSKMTGYNIPGVGVIM